MQITVPTIACTGCVDTLTKSIQKLDAQAVVSGDVDAKTLSIESKADETAIKTAITSVGHEYS